MFQCIDYEVDETTINEITKIIDSHQGIDVSDTQCTENGFQSDNILNLFSDKILKKIIPINNLHKRIFHIHYIKYNKGGYQTEHFHENDEYSFILYLNDSDGNTVLRNPVNKKFTPKKGKIIVFNGKIVHYGEPSFKGKIVLVGSIKPEKIEKINKEKTFKIENFIGIYDNYITEDECNKAIKLFEEQNKFKQTLDRKAFENAPVVEKKDLQYFTGGNNLNVWWSELKSLIFNFDQAFKHYIKETGAEGAYDNNEFHYTQLKLQKTLPTEGYHVWHIEHNLGFYNEPRAFAYSIYLNDIEEGGETEFLHFSKRVKPKTGRIVIWPAAFPYLHRGNPPLLGEKYILTSWMMLR